MMTSSNANIFRVTGPLCGEFTGPGEFPTQRPVMRSFDVFFDPPLNKRLSKQPWGWWFEAPSWSLWRHCNDYKSICDTDDDESDDDDPNGGDDHEDDNKCHYDEVIMGAMASQITSLTIVF